MNFPIEPEKTSVLAGAPFIFDFVKRGDNTPKKKKRRVLVSSVHVLIRNYFSSTVRSRGFRRNTLGRLSTGPDESRVRRRSGFEQERNTPGESAGEENDSHNVPGFRQRGESFVFLFDCCLLSTLTPGSWLFFSGMQQHSTCVLYLMEVSSSSSWLVLLLLLLKVKRFRRQQPAL